MSELKGSTKFRLYFLPWLTSGIHIAVSVIALMHIVPKVWNETGIAAIVFLGISLLLSITVNLIIIVNIKKDLAEQKRYYSDISTEQQEKISYLEQQVLDDERYKRYSKIFEFLNIGFSHIHNALRMGGKIDERDYKQALGEFCNKLSLAFEHVTSMKCHVCIKIIKQSTKVPTKTKKRTAVTLIRDSLHNNRDEIDRNNSLEHVIEQNSDYEHIFNNIGTKKGRCFFSNDLARIEGYKNTSFLKFDPLSVTYFHAGTSFEIKSTEWPLEYRSVICAAICPGIAEQKNTNSLIGFLCIDCKDENIFNESIDTEILCGCADGLYNSLFKFLELFTYKSQPNV